MKVAIKINRSILAIIFTMITSTSIRSDDEIGFSRKTFGKAANVKFFMPEELDYSGMLKITGTDCPNIPNTVFGKSFNNNFSILHAPVRQMQCSNQAASTNKNLTPEICLSYANCFKYKMTMNPEEATAIKIAATNQVAEEAVALFAKNGINQMMDFESLRLYSKTKYGKNFLPVACQEIATFKIPDILPESKDIKCNRDLVEKGFELFQFHCKIPDQNCFKDFADVKRQKSAEAAAEKNITSDFLVEKSYDSLVEVFASDTKILYQISQIMVDETIPMDKRALKIKSFMKDNYIKLDPVFKNYYDREVKNKTEKDNDIFTESLVKYMSNNKNKISSEVLADLENLRMSEAKSMLDAQCEKAANMGNLCTVAASVKGGAEIQVESADFFDLVARKDNYTTSKSPIYTLANNVARCNTFVLTNLKGIQNVKPITLSSDLNLLSTNDQFGLNAFDLLPEANTKRGKLILKPDGSLVQTYKNLEQYSEAISNAPPKKNNELILVKNFSRNISMPEVYTKEIAARNNNFQIRDFDKKELATINTPLPKSNYDQLDAVAKIDNHAPLKIAAPSNNDLFPDLMPTMPIQALPRTEESTNKMSAKSFNDFSEMTEKLSTLESRLAKVKKQESDLNKNNNSETEYLDDVENSFDEKTHSLSPNQKEIRAAQKTLTELKEKQELIDQSPEIVKSAVAPGESHETKSATTGSRDTRSQNESVSGTNSGSSQASGSNSTPVSSIPAAQNAVYTPATNGKYSPTEAVVLLKIEGASTIENKEKMNDLITEGKAFYIEENGTIKYIIPELHNGKIKLDKFGKPVYKTVIKGKVGDFQIAKNGPELPGKSFESPADLKKGDDNISRPIIRYQEFRKLMKTPKR